MDLTNFLVRDKLNYPEIVGAENSPKTVAILKKLMSSSDGELRATLQYFYQSSISKDVEKEISKILEEISIVEMSHVELLSRAIVDFGGDPRYDNAQGQYFNAQNINYSSRLKELLEANIVGENMAIENYQKAIDLVSNESLKGLFRRIIEDEKLHLKIFIYIRDNVKYMSY